MRFLFYLIVIVALAFGGWTYFNLYKLTEALIDNNGTALAEYVDLESIRAQQARGVSAALGIQASPENLIQRSVEAVTEQAANATIDMQWVRSMLGRPTSGQIKLPSFAFFESPRQFLLRYGELGREPVHAYFKLQDWHWKLAEIYP